MSRDRRRHVRAPLLAHVMLFQEQRCLGSFRVLNVSAGGVLLAGQSPALVSRKVTAIVELPGARPLRAEAVIARNLALDAGLAAWSPSSRRTGQYEDDPREIAFALAFTRISASGQDALQDAVLTTLEEAGAATVLVATESVGCGLALKRDLDRLGRPSFCVNSAMEAARFFELQNTVSIAVVDEAFAADAVTGVLRHLAEEQPRVLRVLLSGQDSTLHPQAEELLSTSWLPEDLRRLVRLRGRGVAGFTASALGGALQSH
jgi:hypothetical protein